jgi:hypothetical protein
MDRARRDLPAAYQKYQREGEEQLAKAAAAAAPGLVAKAVRDFEKRVDEIKAADKWRPRGHGACPEEVPGGVRGLPTGVYVRRA